MTVKELIKHLQSLGKKRQNLDVRVIEEKDNGDPKKENEWKDGEWVNSYWEQTDRMFFVEEFQTFCKTCE